MKKITLFCLLFFVNFVYGQDNTNVSATVTDSDNISWFNGSWSAQLYNPRGGIVNYISTGQPVQTAFAGVLDGTGSFTQVMPNNLALAPAGTGWQFTICPFASSVCTITTPITVTGASQNLSSILATQIKPPRFPALGTGYYGYSDVEINTTPNPGGSYFNVLNNSVEYWNPATHAFSIFSSSSNTCLLTGCFYSGGPSEQLYQIQSTPPQTGSLTGVYRQWFWSGLVPNSFLNGQVNHNFNEYYYLDSTPGCYGFLGTCYNTEHKFSNLLMNVNGSGGTNAYTNMANFYGVGDHIMFENYLQSMGGSSDGGGPEGTKGVSYFVSENPTTWTGNNTNSGAGQTQIVATCSTLCGGSPYGYPGGSGTPAGVGQDMILNDEQATVASGQIMSFTNGPSGEQPGTVTVNITSGIGNLAVSTCEATLNSILNPIPNPVGSGFQTLTFTVTLVTGTCVNGQLMNFEGNNHEQALITSVTAPSGGQQTITANIRKYHSASSYMFENPPSDAGLYGDIVVNHSGSLQFPVELLGIQSISSNTVVFWWRRFYAGTQPNFAQFPAGNMVVGTMGAGSLTNTSGTVQMQLFGGSRQQYFQSTNIYISGATNSAFNGVCTNASYDQPSGGINANPATLNCTQAASTGQTSGGANISLTDSTQDNPYGNSRVNFYQGASIVDPQDELHPIVVNGKNQYPVDGLQFQLEPNNMPLGAGDALVEQHGEAQFHNYQSTLFIANPNCYSCNIFTIEQNGNYSGGQNSPVFQVRNDSSISSYKYFGGTQSPTSLDFLIGLWGNIIDMADPPTPGSAIINSPNCPPTGLGCTDTGYSFLLYNFGGNGGSNFAQYFPSNASMQWNGYQQFNSVANDISFYIKNNHNFDVGIIFGGYNPSFPTPTVPLWNTAAPTPGHAVVVSNCNTSSECGIADGGTIPAAPLRGTSGSIGGGALTAGACATGTVTITGATTSMVATASGAGADPGGNYIVRGYVSASNTVTVQVCAVIAGTPAAQTYNVAINQ